MAQRRNWTRDEVVRALDLYLRTPFGRMHSRNPEIMDLARRLDRTASAVALKLVNLAALDDTLPRAGMRNASRMDREVWAVFFRDPVAMLDVIGRGPPAARGSEAARLETDPGFAEAAAPSPLGQGRDVAVSAKARRGQQVFRQAVLTAYGGRCAVTGLDDPRLLVASHIEPWAEAAELHLDPANGLCLNALHDRAFDRGLITFDEGWRVAVSPRLGPSTRAWFERSEHAELRLPERFRPSPDRMARHRARHAGNFRA